MINSVLKLPEKTKDEQRHSKFSWNSEHCKSTPDFYTTGYSGKSINEFIEILKNAGVATVVDEFASVIPAQSQHGQNTLSYVMNCTAEGLPRPFFLSPFGVRQFLQSQHCYSLLDAARMHKCQFCCFRNLPAGFNTRPRAGGDSILLLKSSSIGKSSIF